jgi:eukaryotic translation initiation factor 2C
MLGADVSHAGAGMKNQPSVASMVWSYDDNAMKYAAFSSVQEPRQEHIEELGAMMMVCQACYVVSVELLNII